VVTEEQLTAATPETGEIDINKGGVALLKERFPLRSVPAYMFTAVEGFRITQFVDIDEIQARFNKHLKVLEDTQRRFPLVETEGGRPGNQRQCSTWSTVTQLQVFYTTLVRRATRTTGHLKLVE
jgi:hypothetical protein